MATAIRTQRRYDHRLQELVRTTQDIDCDLQRGVPRSTARGWLTKPGAQVVTVEALNMDTLRLRQEVLRLHRRAQKLTSLLRVLLVVFRMSGYSLNQARLPEGIEDAHDSAGNTGFGAEGGAESGAVESESGATGGAAGPQQAPLDADLAAVVEAWPSLPDVAKAAILAIVRPT